MVIQQKENKNLLILANSTSWADKWNLTNPERTVIVKKRKKFFYKLKSVKPFVYGKVLNFDRFLGRFSRLTKNQQKNFLNRTTKSRIKYFNRRAALKQKNYFKRGTNRRKRRRYLPWKFRLQRSIKIRGVLLPFLKKYKFKKVSSFKKIEYFKRLYFNRRKYTVRRFFKQYYSKFFLANSLSLQVLKYRISGIPYRQQKRYRKRTRSNKIIKRSFIYSRIKKLTVSTVFYNKKLLQARWKIFKKLSKLGQLRKFGGTRFRLNLRKKRNFRVSYKVHFKRQRVSYKLKWLRFRGLFYKRFSLLRYFKKELDRQYGFYSNFVTYYRNTKKIYVKKLIRKDLDRLFFLNLVNHFSNCLLTSGNRKLSHLIILKLFLTLKFKVKSHLSTVFLRGLKNVRPLFFFKSMCIGGKKYTIPIMYSESKSLKMAAKWLSVQLENNGTASLFDCVLAASKNEGVLIKKRKEHHLTAYENKSYVRFLRFLKSF